MSKRQLKDKAIKVKGGASYVMVKDRLEYLASEHEGKYSIETSYEYLSEQRMWVCKAVLTLNGCTYTGLSQNVESDDPKSVKFTSALEDCETSAVGRACAMAGIGVLESIATADEVNKAQNLTRLATPKQIDWIRSEASKVSGAEEAGDIDEWVEKYLTIKPEQIPLAKVKDAVDKIRQIGKELAAEEKLNRQAQEELVPEVTDEDIKKLEKGELPY